MLKQGTDFMGSNLPKNQNMSPTSSISRGHTPHETPTNYRLRPSPSHNPNT